MTLIVPFLIVGCDQQGHPIEEFNLEKLERGVASEADVRSVMGMPDTVWEEEDGERSLEYPKGPAGARTWIFFISKNGKLLDYKQVLTAENFANIHVGMSKDAVRKMLGKPRTIVQFPRKNEEVWDWHYIQGDHTHGLFNVHINITTGRVTGTSGSDLSGR